MTNIVLIVLLIILIILIITLDKDFNKERFIRQHLYELWSKTEPIFKKHDINYFAMSGTLLGAVRNEGIIEHDDDIDIAVLEDDEYKLHDKNFLKDLEENELFFKTTKTFVDKIMFKNKKVFIDIFILKKIDNEKLVFKNEKFQKIWPNEYFFVKEVFPLLEYKFGDYKIKGPNNPIPYFERYFGNDWRIPKKTHNHLSEII